VSFAGLDFSFYADPILDAVLPSAIMLEHSSRVVRLRGSGFMRSAAIRGLLKCAAHSNTGLSGGNVDPLTTSSVAAWLSSEMIECRISAGAPGDTMSLVVTMNGRDFTASAVLIHVLADLKVTFISPSMGYIGTDYGRMGYVSVHGSGFVNSSDLLCRFGHSAAAPWVVFVSRTRVDCGLPLHKVTPGIVHVAISVDNGATFTATGPGTAYSFFRAPVLTRLLPATALLAGGEEITVLNNHVDSATAIEERGGPFIDSTDLVCHIGGADGEVATVLHATFLNSSALLCTAPPSNEPRLAEIRISILGSSIIETASFDVSHSGLRPRLR
jgi:hypothetical protein